jgi:BASS family bile acid:Na+ symporter
MHLFRRPGKLARAFIAMDVIMPLFALAVAALTSVPTPVKVALVALSVAPLPPLLPGRTSKVSSSGDYTIGLLFTAALVAIVFVPLSIALMGSLFGLEAHVPFSKVVTVMLMTVLAPLAAGIFVHRMWPSFAARYAGPVSIFALVLLIASALPVLFVAVPQAVALAHNGSVAAFAAFVVLGLAVGHYLGGPDPEDRTVLAIATASRHPALAIVAASALFPDQKLAIAAVALYLLVNFVIATPYSIWRKRLHRSADDEDHALDFAPPQRELHAKGKEKELP